MTTNLTLWGRKNSANVQKPLWALAELGLYYEHVAVGGAFKGLDTDAYLTMNPNGLVPTLRDGDMVLWESNAILRYLAAAYGAGELWADDPRKRALVDQWTDWVATTFQPAWIGVFVWLVRTPKSKHDPAAIAGAIGQAGDALRLLDVQLAGRDYIAGNFSYADIAAGVAMYRWFTMDFERPDLPNVAAWYQRLQQRPAFAETVMVSYADMYAK